MLKAMEGVRAHGGSEGLVREAASLVQLAFEEIKLGATFDVLKSLGADVDPAHKLVQATSAAAAVVHKLDATSPLAEEAKSYVARLSAKARAPVRLRGSAHLTRTSRPHWRKRYRSMRWCTTRKRRNLPSQR